MPSLPSNSARIAVVYHSGYGHTKVVAEAVTRGAESVPGTQVALIPVDEAPARAAERGADRKRPPDRRASRAPCRHPGPPSRAAHPSGLNRAA